MTSDSMAHEEAREALGALALDALDASERAAVLAHIAECAGCREELVALRAAAAELTYVVTPVPMPAAQRDRIRASLVSRAAAERQPAATGTPATNRPTSAPALVPPETAANRNTPAVLRPVVVPQNVRPWRGMETGARWLSAAAVIVAVVSVGMLVDARSERDTLRDSLQVALLESRVDGRVLDSLRAGLTARDKMIAHLTGPDVSVVTLASTGARPISARMFWDQSVNAWTFVAHRLPAPPLGRTYQLWLVTAKGKISAGTFRPTPTGDAVVHATYTLARDALAAVAVTDEPMEGSPQPTTVPFIVGMNTKGR